MPSHSHSPQLETKKLHERSLPRKKRATLSPEAEILPDQLFHLMDQLALTDSEKEEFESPKRREDGRYVTSEATLDRWIDPRIFRETQVKRLVRWLTTTPPIIRFFFNWLFIKRFGMKVHYYERQENEHPEALYQTDHPLTDGDPNQFSVHNLGHATQLIQTSGMNILTDPVFGDLAPIIYPSMTQPFGLDVRPQDLPRIDVILISHNHRDHVDERSLRQLIANGQQPQLLVPMGDEAFFRRLGFTQVQAMEWHEEVTLTSPIGQSVTFCGEPADHRSGRKGYDAHQSLVMGWTVSPKERDEILYFAGDTAKISTVRMKSLALDIYQLYQHKAPNGQREGTLPKIINMEPGGPNYTRKDMRPTHQSAVDSLVSALRLAIELEEISTTHGDRIAAEKWLDATATVLMHHNRFELGPDRFNENVYVFNRFLSYLQMDDAELERHRHKQQKKSEFWSLFHRRKDFIVEGAQDLKALAVRIWPSQSPLERQQLLIQFLEARTHYPIIKQKVKSEDVLLPFGSRSPLIPDTSVIDKEGRMKQKGEKVTGPSPR